MKTSQTTYKQGGEGSRGGGVAVSSEPKATTFCAQNSLWAQFQFSLSLSLFLFYFRIIYEVLQMQMRFFHDAYPPPPLPLSLSSIKKFCPRRESYEKVNPVKAILS